MKYLDLEDPPVSEKYLSKYLDLVFKPSFVNSIVTVLSAQGFGILSVSRFILRNSVYFPELPKNRVYMCCDTGIISNEDGFVRDCLTSLLSHLKSTQILSSHEIDAINELLTKVKLSISDLGLIIRHITEERGYYITLVMENFGNLYAENRAKEVGLLAVLLKINPIKTSYIFLSSHEFNDNNITQLQGFASYFTQNIVWGKDLWFDSLCAGCLFRNNGKWANVNLDRDFIALSSKLSFGDPTVLKHIAVTATRDQSFASALLKLKSIKAQYNLISEVFLDNRYRKLLATLLPKTHQSLLNGTFEANDYLLKTGLVSKEELFNPLFSEFLSRDSLKHQIEGVNIGTREILIGSLTVKELSIFELLESSTGSIVSREALAGVLWGENWQDYYSDWALNKQISNLRKKLRTCGYDKEVKVLKTEGFMLV